MTIGELLLSDGARRYLSARFAEAMRPGSATGNNPLAKIKFNWCISGWLGRTYGSVQAGKLTIDACCPPPARFGRRIQERGVASRVACTARCASLQQHINPQVRCLRSKQIFTDVSAVASFIC